MIAAALTELDPHAGAIAGVYVAALAVGLVYLGEHYVIDVLGGVVLTAAVRWTESQVRPMAARLARR
jgi:membrane-associated phospholipid phosphatase